MGHSSGTIRAILLLAVAGASQACSLAPNLAAIRAQLLSSPPPTVTGVAATVKLTAPIASATAFTGGGTQLTITGTGFLPGAVVSVDGADCPVTSSNTTRLQCVAPARAAGEGVASVAVTNLDGQSSSRPGSVSYGVDAFTQVELIAGNRFQNGWTDGAQAAASFNSVRGLALDGGTLYAADFANGRLRGVDLAHGRDLVSTLGIDDSFSGTSYVTGAIFDPAGIAKARGALYIASNDRQVVTKYDPAARQFSVIAGTLDTSGDSEALAADPLAAHFRDLAAITHADGKLYVADAGNNVIRSIDLDTGAVALVAGTQSTDGGYADTASGSPVMFDEPSGLAALNGALYVADSKNCVIRRIDLGTGAVTTAFGHVYTTSCYDEGLVRDGNGDAARFIDPTDVTTDGRYLYVLDGVVIRKIDPQTRAVTTIAGKANSTSDVIGSLDKAAFGQPRSILADPSGLYVGTDKAILRLR